MMDERPPVWEIEYDIETTASPEAVWALFQDVAGWSRWNAGIETAEAQGPFAAGTEIVTLHSGRQPGTTRLLEVRENAGFLGEIRLGDLRIFVDHRIEAATGGTTRVLISVEAFGPSCEEIGAMIAADYPENLRALASLAECEACQRV